MSDITVTYDAINEVYCLLQSYLREGKINAEYDDAQIELFVEQLHRILKKQPPVETAEIVETIG